MKRKSKSTLGLIRGAPTAVVISVAIHLILLVVAGGLVVFTVINKPEKKFIPPPSVERPKMDLKKPRVKMKKTSKPRSAQRIVSKNVASMPDIQLPDVSGTASGLSGGVGGYELLPDISTISLLGSSESVSVGNDFEGTFYSFSYDRMGNEESSDVAVLLRLFNENDWNLFTFSQIYRSPKKLYTTHFMMPPFSSVIGPRAFGIENSNFNLENWVVHYKGKIASPKDGRFRFWGQADQMLFVRINGELVFKSTWFSADDYMVDWQSPSDENLQYYMGNNGAVVGDWFDLKVGEPIVMEVLIGDNANIAGKASFMLVIEDESEDYDRNRDGLPYLPAFKTSEFLPQLKAKIEYTLIRGEVDLDSDLMFNVY